MSSITLIQKFHNFFEIKIVLILNTLACKQSYNHFLQHNFLIKFGIPFQIKILQLLIGYFHMHKKNHLIHINLFHIFLHEFQIQKFFLFLAKSPFSHADSIII